MCRVLEVAPSGYYEWLLQPVSNRAQEDARLLRLIRASFTASHGIYGAPRVFLDLREAGETCSKHRVARLMRQANLRALHGYRTRRWAVGKPSVLIPNLLKRQFTATNPTPPGSRTSPTSARGKAGSIWPWSWICSRAGSSDGPPSRPFTVSSCSTPC
jgi:transposase InsO family protein